MLSEVNLSGEHRVLRNEEFPHVNARTEVVSGYAPMCQLRRSTEHCVFERDNLCAHLGWANARFR